MTAQHAKPPMMLGGFDDPGVRAQSVFRATLRAMAHPGTPVEIDPGTLTLAGLDVGTVALLLALADIDTNVWLPGATHDDIRRYLKFHCACPFVSEVSGAVFAVVPRGQAMPALAACAQGLPSYPDRSTTVLLEVEALQGGPRVALRGPGIEDVRHIAPQGLPADFWSQWQDNHARFPLGVDVVLIQGNTLCALPRTTRVES